MVGNRIPFWIASDLLAQARGHGVPLPEDFAADLLGIIQRAHRSWVVDQREAEDDRRREERRRVSRQRGWF